MRVVINAEALREIRVRSRLRQQDLADATGLSNSYISNIERGHRLGVHPRIADALAAALHVSVSAITTVEVAA